LYKNIVAKWFYYQIIVNNVLLLMVAKTKNNFIFVVQNLEIQSRHAKTQQET